MKYKRLVAIFCCISIVLSNMSMHVHAEETDDLVNNSETTLETVIEDETMKSSEEKEDIIDESLEIEEIVTTQTTGETEILESEESVVAEFETVEEIDILSEDPLEYFASGTYGENITWMIDDQGTLTIKGDGEMNDAAGNYDVPWYNYINQIVNVHIENGITSVGDYAFYGLWKLNNVELPDSVKKIGKLSFFDCESLSSIELPDGITNIGESAFEECSGLTSIELSNNITYLGGKAFFGCTSLKSVNIPIKLNTIPTYLFANCTNLNNIEIPANITEISDSAFAGCTNLTNITLHNGLKVLGINAFARCTSLQTIELPNSLTTIGSSAFSRCESLTKIDIPDQVKYISGYLFFNCKNLTTLTMADDVSNIDYSAFAGCIRLNDIYIYNSNCTIGDTIYTIDDSITIHGYCDSTAFKYAQKYKKPFEPLSGSNHTFGEWVIIKEATDVEEGQMSSVCTICGFVGYETIPVDDGILRGKCGLEATYELDKDGVLTIKGSGYVEANWLDISPESVIKIIIQEGITGIDQGAFEFFINVQSIQLPYSLDVICDGAFGYCESLKTINIPGVLDFLGNQVFYNCSSLSSVTLPNGIEYIGDGTFYGCSSLTSITIPESVVEIRAAAFCNCLKLRDVDLNEGLERILGNAFYGCDSLESIEFPATLTYIDYEAFYSCDLLKSIILSNNISYVDISAFYECFNLEELYFYNPECQINVYIDKLPDSTTIYGYCGSTANNYAALYKKKFIAYEDSEHIYGEWVIEKEATKTEDGIRAKICVNCGNKISETYVWVWTPIVGTCGEGLTWELDEEGLLTIDGDGIMDDFSEKEAPWYEYVSDINEVQISEGIERIGNFAFYGCINLKKVSFSDDVIAIGDFAFSECSSIKEISLPDSVKKLGYGSFSKCGLLEQVTLSSNLEHIDNSVFSECSSLKEIEIPESVTTMLHAVFSGCTSLESVVLHDNITFIPMYTFYNCDSLKIIELSSIVDCIDVRAFDDCDALTDIYINNPDCDIWPQNAIPANTVIHGYCGSAVHTYALENNNDFVALENSDHSYGEWIIEKEATKMEDGIRYKTCVKCGNIFEQVFTWDDLTIEGTCGENLKWQLDRDGVLVISGTKKMYDYSEGEAPWYEYRNQIKKLIMSSGVNYIGNYTFYKCTNLTEVSISEDMLAIGDFAFSECSSIKEISLPDSVKKLGYGSFSKCGLLEQVTLSSNLEHIDNSVFSECSSLKEIEIPESVTTMLHAVFSGCTSLESVVLHDNIIDIPMFMFRNCKSLKTIELPDSVQYIDIYAFDGCSQLESIIIPDSTVSIDMYAFNDCKNLEEIYVYNPNCYLGTDCFLTSNNQTKVYAYCPSTIATYCRNNNLIFVSLGGCIFNNKELIEEASCEEKGSYISVCDSCGNMKTEIIPATGHTYTLTFKWNDDYSSCIAIFTCNQKDDYKEFECSISIEETPATETSNGEIVYAASVDFNGQKYIDTQSVITEMLIKKPLPVTNLKAVSAGKNKVKLTWTASEGAEGYLIYGQKNGKYGYVGMTTKGTTFIDTKALDTDYNFYWVFPYVKNSENNMIPGGCTKYVYAKGVCLAVTNLKASSVKGGLKLTWTASTDAEGYLIYGIENGGSYGYVGMVTRGTTYTATKASKTEYNFYWVFPYHRDANGKMIVGGTAPYTYGRAK